MRVLLLLLVVVACAVAVAAPARAHGDAIIRAAAAALEADPVYVHRDAIPTLTQEEAAELRRRIDAAGGRTMVAILPADALHEARDAETVVNRIRDGVGRSGTYAVVVAGQFAATSTLDDLGPATGARLAREAFRERLSLAPTLYALVELVREARDTERPNATREGRTTWLVIGASALALLGLVLLAPTLRGLATGGTMRRARRRSSVG